MTTRDKALAIGTVLFGFLSITASAGAETISLPGGASTLRESYGDWIVSCAVRKVNGAAGKACVLAQEQVDRRSKQRVLAIELRPKSAGADGTLALPFGLALEKGISLQIDEGQALPELTFRTCVPTGCLASVNLNGNAISSLRKGKSLGINVVADGGREMKFAISLNGFSGALDRTITLLK